MEFVVFTGVLLFIFLFMIVQELMQAKNEEKMFRNSLLENSEKNRRRNIRWRDLQGLTVIWNDIRKRNS